MSKFVLFVTNVCFFALFVARKFNFGFLFFCEVFLLSEQLTKSVFPFGFDRGCVCVSVDLRGFFMVLLC